MIYFSHKIVFNLANRLADSYFRCRGVREGASLYSVWRRLNTDVNTNTNTNPDTSPNTIPITYIYSHGVEE